MLLNSQNEPTRFELFWVVVSNIFYFHPYLGKIPILTNIFQMGWNHQLVMHWIVFFQQKLPEIEVPSQQWDGMEALFVGEMMDMVEMQVMDCDELSVFFAKSRFYLMSSHGENMLQYYFGAIQKRHHYVLKYCFFVLWSYTIGSGLSWIIWCYPLGN